MKILITGAGMVGCYLARELIQSGHEVTLFELNPVLAHINNVVSPGRVKVIRGNVLNLPDIMHAIKDSGAERMVHMAALIRAGVNQVPYTAVQVNVLGMTNVLESAQLSGIGRVVYTSTGGVYRRKSKAPMKEDHRTEGSSLYNASKLSAEQIGIQYSRLLEIGFIIVRYAVGYGPTFSAKASIYGSIMEELITRSAKGQPVSIQRTQPFMKLNELIYVKDMAHGAALAVTAKELKDGIFNIGTGALSDLSDLAAALRALIPEANITIEEPLGSRQEDPDLYPMDSSRAKSQLGYEPKYSLREGLKDYLAEIPRVFGKPSYS